ncbi:MAG: ABC transporter permease [Flavobacteriales bacterium]|nr:ABC transporter permease [Flavobacteriales bacterium]
MIFLRLVRESVMFALHALWVNKLRTILSLLGITIGIFAIIAVFTGIDSLEINMRKSFDKLGTNVVYVQKWPWTFGPNYAWWKYWQRPLTTVEEAELVAERCHAASEVAFQASDNGTVKYRNNSADRVTILAVSQTMDRIQNYEFSEGRFFSEIESAGGRNLAILGANIASSLFPLGNALGKNIKVMGRSVRVVGVLKKEGESMFDTGGDNTVIIPLKFAGNIMYIKGPAANPMIMVQARPGIPNSELISELEGVMRSIRKIRPGEESNFALNESKLLTNNFSGIFTVLSLVGLIIGGFSILVGGIGIANIMFVSVKERTNLIGIQKAIGAKSHFILIQFLSESITLCLIGGFFGLMIVWFGTIVASSLLDMEFSLTFGNVMIGVLASGLIGVIFGFIPAWMASRMDPVEAIRS